MTSYTDDSNPYQFWHMRRAFRIGWEAAEDDLTPEQAHHRLAAANLNRMTTAAWWRGYHAQLDQR